MEANKKLYFYLDENNGNWCISNTVLVLLYTAVSFMTICFTIVGRQIVYSKRNRSLYMDATEKPVDSDADDDAEVKTVTSKD